MSIVQFILFMCLIAGMGMLGGLLRRGFSGKPGPSGGETYEFSVTRGRNRRISQVRIALAAPDVLRFMLRRENFLDRCGKALGLTREWETHDRSFDDSIFILSDDRVLCEALSVDEELRRAVMDVFADQQAKSVECANGRIWIVFAPGKRDFDSLEDPQVADALAREYSPALTRVRARLADLHARAWDGERDPGEARSRWLLIVAGICGAAGIVAFILQINVSSLPRQLLSNHIDHNATVAAGAAVMIALLALTLLVGRTSRTHLVALALLLVLVPAVWLGGRYFYILRNEKLDAEPATDYVARIDDVYSRSGKSRRYYLVVHGWPDERFDRTLQVSSALYSEFRPGSCARFELHNGSLGDPWLASVEPDSRCDQP